MLPTAIEDALGQEIRGRPEGHDNCQLSNNGGFERTKDCGISGDNDDSDEMPTGEHNRRTAFAGPGVHKQFFLTLIIQYLLIIFLLNLKLTETQVVFPQIYAQEKGI